MTAGGSCEALLRAANQLCAELGCGEDGEEVPGARSPFSDDRVLSPEHELLVAQVRRRLAQIAVAVGAEQALDSAVLAALDGSEMVIRGELVKGSHQQLPSLLPSFVLLITLPLVDQDEALALSNRASELVAEMDDDRC